MSTWLRTGRFRWLAILVVLAMLSLAAADIIVERTLAGVELPAEVALPASALVFDSSGKLIATYRDEITRFIVDASDLPDRILEAVIAAEDRDFYEHEGVSLSSIARAAWRNVRSGEVEEGGSTITQQYVKNAILKDSEQTLARKMREALLAIKLEREFTKDEILERYLNAVYFGRGAYGIEAAARVYFGKHASQLSLSQSAFLAGIIPAPEAFQPDSGDNSAIERRDRVLAAMREEGYIGAADEARAAGNVLKLTTSPEVRQKHQRAAYFLEWIRKEYLYPRFGDCLYTCGLKIYTTLDMDAQRAAERAVAAELTEKKDPQAALVSMTRRGRIRAMIGGRNFTNIQRARGFNFATDGVRQAGSSFKPFTLLAAIEQNISPYSYFSGHSPKTITSPFCAGSSGAWTPENYGGASYGTLRLEEATYSSVNTVYAELIADIGPSAVADLLERFGFESQVEEGQIAPNCSLSLGTLDVSVLQMARAYAGIAARGRLPEVVPIERVEDREGNCLLGFGTPKKMKCEERIDISGEQVIDANWVDVMTRTLTGVISGGTGTAAQIDRPAAGKTGTTQDSRDAWFAGYIPQLATVVWMGYPIDRGPDEILGNSDDISPLMSYCSTVRCRPVHGIEVTGGSFPARIWASFMRFAVQDMDIEFFTAPTLEPTTILNPPPPPKKDKKKKKGKKDDHGKDKHDKDDDDD